MSAFATVGDLEARFRPLTPSEVPKAEALLADAEMLVKSEVAAANKSVEDIDADLLKAVTCFVAKRGWGPDSAPLSGVSSYTETTGPFSTQMSFANPSGDLYLTKAERKWLGISGSFARCVFPGATNAD